MGTYTHIHTQIHTLKHTLEHAHTHIHAEKYILYIFFHHPSIHPPRFKLVQLVSLTSELGAIYCLFCQKVTTLESLKALYHLKVVEPLKLLHFSSGNRKLLHLLTIVTTQVIPHST